MRLRETGLSSRKVGGEMVILDLDRSRYLTVSGSGVFLLELLRQERDREELIQALVDSFEVDEHTARCDVVTWMRSSPTSPRPACSPVS